jgi:beta-N-acetylhexosaminidase
MMINPRRGAAFVLALAVTLGLVSEPAQAADRTPQRIERVIEAMTLEEKVAQLFVLQVYGKTADTADPAAVAANRRLYGVDNAQQLIARYRPGGIIYYSVDPPNVESPAQLATFSNGIQRAALAQRVPIPATISIDQEGGIVARVQAPATQSPGAMALAAGRRAADAFNLARITGTELRAIGINQNYAPVADVNVNPANPVIGVRSFGSDPGLVARMVVAQAKGHRAANVIATAKHFPGHGDTTVDSHLGVPVIDHTREEWERLDLPPFRAAIARGIDSIMTAHIIVPSLDPTRTPSTVSRPIITGILRKELGYDGVVVTDALDMRGARTQYGDDRIPVMAVQAGVDVLLKPPLDAAGNGLFGVQYNAVLNAVRSGELTEARIDESVRRILTLKFKRGLFHDPFADESKVARIVGHPAHLAAAQRATDRTTTLVKNSANLLPLTPGARNVLVAGWGVTTTRTLADELTARGATTTVQETGLSPNATPIAQVTAAAQQSDLIVAVTNRAWDVKESLPGEPHNGPGQRNLVKSLLATGKPVIVLAVRDPYDIAHFPEAPTYVATYSYTTEALRAAAKTLFGEINPTGRLPVTIPSATTPSETLYPFGHGLSHR